MNKNRFTLLSFIALQLSFLFFSPSAGAYERFAVEKIGGVPMMTLDGTPVRARIFWGRVGSRSLYITHDFQKVQFDFQPTSDGDGRGTMHFRFGKKPGVMILDDYEVVEKKTGRVIAGPYRFETPEDYTQHWKTWHEKTQGKVIAALGTEPGCGLDGSGGLKITIFPGNEKLATDFHMYHQWCMDLKPDREYTVRFAIRAAEGEPRTARIAFYRPDASHVALGGYGNALGAQTRLAADAGVNFVSFMLCEDFWMKPDGSYDFTGLDAYCDRILAANPDALIIPRIELNAAKWWLDANPDEKMRWEHIAPQDLEQNWNWASPASEKYRRAACDALRAAIRHLDAKYGNSIAGYHPAGQNTQEWFTANTWHSGHADYSPAGLHAFRLWLREKYASDAALQKAWGNPDVTFDSAQVPSPDLRDKSMQFPIIDPALKSDVPAEFASLVDYNRFFQQAMTQNILALARVVKEETHGKKLCFFFYGYNYEFASVFKGPAASAHYNMRAVLESPDIDVICSPMSYFDRQPGGGGCCMLNAESVTAAGKIYLYEDDTSTYLAAGNQAPGWENGSETPKGTRNLLLRNVAESAVRNFGTWWMDLGGSGWFDSPEIWNIMEELRGMDEYFLKNPTPYTPEVGLILDEKTMLQIGSGQYTAACVSHIRRSFNRLGAPYAQYLLDDLLSGRVAPPKLCVITNAACFPTAEMRECVEKKLGTTVLWVEFSGLTPEKLREAAVSAGIHLYTDEPCCVWANGPYVVLHAPEDAVYHLHAFSDSSSASSVSPSPSASTASTASSSSSDSSSLPASSASFTDALTGDSVSSEIPMKKGDTRILQIHK